ncbi:hypothetical protein EUX98_g2606 [Antrodiella citrinella]|uniref:Cullin family profile domain-containing protein n=1 Tax=Antrodiella citrinella TaxID=2447956 RepID=A0A4S4MYK4_9APHY|nr:hypothetical protein EUX98_g2606 [Antrodiella citrinella]
MSEDIFNLLTFPGSKAFEDYHPTEFSVITESRDTSSGSPPRKTPRLDADLDSASASRSRLVTDDKVGNASVKKVAIRIQLVGPSIQQYSDRHFDTSFATLRRTLRALFTPGDRLPESYERIYAACRVCATYRAEGIYDNLKLEVQRCIGEVARLLQEDARQGVEWVQPFVEKCEWFERQVGLLQSLFAYLDRVYIYALPGSPSIRSLCYDQFALGIFQNAAIVLKLQSGITEWVAYERTLHAAHPQRPSILSLIARLSHHNKYAEIFESTYLSTTAVFYTAESVQKTTELDAQKFLVHCQGRREEEIARAKETMPEVSWVKAREKADKALLDGRLQWLVEEAMEPLMNARSEVDLGRMFKLFGAVGGVQVFLNGWSKHIEAKVKTIVTDKAHDDDMVQNLLAYKHFTDILVSDTFAETIETPPPTTVKKEDDSSSKVLVDLTAPSKQPRQEFAYALSDSFRRGFKQRRNKPAEMLAKHLDKAMRKGQQGRKDEDFEGELDKVLGLYRFTDDKDVFRTFYHKALAKRLLLEKSASDDFEKAMLKKLKEQYDPEFSMGDHMFNDLALSREGMQADLTRYTAFYKLKHQGHKLDWDHALGTATLRARFARGEKELSVSLYQALVLLLFNEEDTEIGFADIKETTGIEDGELRRTLQSLALGKKRVLKKQPMGKDVLDTDVFVFNADFVDAAHRVHINSIQVKETAEETTKTHTLIESDRKHVLDAAIVRLMKAKKEMHNEQLKAATIDAVKNHFVPNVGLIKDRIDELVEQEYLRRHETDMNVFVYVA